MRLGSLSLLLLALPPALAVVSGVVWASGPRHQRQAIVRWTLIVSVSLTAIEVLLGLFFLIVLRLFVDAFVD